MLLLRLSQFFLAISKLGSKFICDFRFRLCSLHFQGFDWFLYQLAKWTVKHTIDYLLNLVVEFNLEAARHKHFSVDYTFEAHSAVFGDFPFQNTFTIDKTLLEFALVIVFGVFECSWAKQFLVLQATCDLISSRVDHTSFDEIASLEIAILNRSILVLLYTFAFSDRSVALQDIARVAWNFTI